MKNQGPDTVPLPVFPQGIMRSPLTLGRWPEFLVVLMLLAIGSMAAADVPVHFTARSLLVILNLLFGTLVAGVVAVLVTRNFMESGNPSLLLLGCGSLCWGTAALSGVVLASWSGAFDMNVNITIYSVFAWLSALCHMAGVTLSARFAVPLPVRTQTLAGAYLLTLCVLAAVAFEAVLGGLPRFFSYGNGGTLVRQMLMASVSGMFLLAALILAHTSSNRAFARWYSLALVLLAGTTFGVLFMYDEGWLVWLCRGAQWLAGGYMLVAVLLSRQNGRFEVSIQPGRATALYRYSVAVALVVTATVFRLVFLDDVGARFVFVTFFPALILTALYGGLGPGLLSTILSMLLTNYFWIEPVGRLTLAGAAEIMPMAIFAVSGCVISLVTESLHRALIRAHVAEGRLREYQEHLEEQVRTRTEELKHALATADSANHAKSRFLAAASHDLRQPLSAISLYAGVLKNTTRPSEQKVVAQMQQCITSLSALLSDLLDLSKLDAGVVIPSISNFSVGELFAGLATSHQPEALVKGLRLHWVSTQLTGRTDAVLFRRLLGNLLENALRYTERGGVLIGCRRRQGKVWVEVWDTGVGIPADRTAEIFEEFKQLGDGARNKGSGLGLAIVAKTAALLGLEIQVRSRPGRGSAFAIELPLGESKLVPSAATKPAPASRPLRIALVEDNSMVRDAIVEGLRALGHQVRGSATKAALLAELEQFAPDIVVADYRLTQGVAGIEVIAAVRAQLGTELPAILIQSCCAACRSAASSCCTSLSTWKPCRPTLRI
jgi:signal transduction histidine kinase